MVAIEVARRSARAILIDDDGSLVLIKRTKPGVPVYWTTAGGTVEDSDASPEAAMHREIFEELGATATGASQVFLFSTQRESGVLIQYVFVARLTSLDLSLRNGPELANPAKGRYDPDRVSLLTDEALAAIDLQAPELKAFILANREALLAEAGNGGHYGATVYWDRGLAGGRGLAPAFPAIAVIVCGKRAIDAFSAHDHGSGGSGGGGQGEMPGLSRAAAPGRGGAGPAAASGAPGTSEATENARIPEVNRIPAAQHGREGWRIGDGGRARGSLDPVTLRTRGTRMPISWIGK
jgi:ADP-ribose pyrophosphatase YjhB (NUDIX family)